MARRLTVVSALRKALTILRKGWVKGTFYEVGTPFNRPNARKAVDCYCALGAINRACGLSASGVSYGLDSAPQKLVAEVASVFAKGLPQAKDQPTTSITRWNDAPRRTFEQVEQRFLKSIERAKKAA